MNLLGSLIPGVREVRAPLVSGYLWCAFLWLLLASHVPSGHSNAVYEHLVELADAMGPLGKAVAVSIIAYLIGSLVQSAFELVRSRVMNSILGPPESGVRFAEDDGALEQLDSLAALPSIANPHNPIWAPRPGREEPMFTIQEIADRELGESFRQLQLAVEEREAKQAPSVKYFINGGTTMIRLRLQEKTGGTVTSEFVIPRVTVGDVLAQRSFLETRLLEVAPGTGAQIERLQAEADFRSAIALPLLFLVALLSVDVSLWWLVGVVVPYALHAQGKEFSRQAVRALFAALSARAQTPDMERLTPIYERYRTFTSRLANAISRAV